MVTGNNILDTESLKKNIGTKFKLKDVVGLKNFLGIEVAWLNKGNEICSWKYSLDMLEGIKTWELRHDVTSYHGLVRKLIYPIITLQDISHAVLSVNLCMHCI